MNRHIPLPALKIAATPRITRWTSRLAILLLIGTPIALVLIPWQQNVHGFGRATAFNPVYRTQFIVSPIEGRVKKWYVVEGQRVERGDVIAELIDNDPMLVDRLEQEQQALADRRTASMNRVEQIELAIRNLETSFTIQKQQQSAIVDLEDQQLLRARQDRIDAEAALLAAEQHETRTKALAPRGATEREVEMAVRDTVQMKARLESAKLNIGARESARKAAADFLSRIDADQQVAVKRETSTLESAKGELKMAEAALLQMSTRLARQRAQKIECPCDGVVYRLLANAEMGGMLVRPGERLAMIVPDIKPGLKEYGHEVMALAGGWITADEAGETPGIVAELFIDGNDLPLVRQGDRVRLQFEGWPAVQFVAIPEAAAGTFGGRVLLVDPAANERGQFRILVEPDPAEQGDPKKRWPDPDYLRQGVQVQGWVLLDRVENRVTLGWELWRLLNGFPVTRSLENKPKSSPLGPVR